LTNRGGAERIPLKLRPVFEGIGELTDAVCRKHLNQEYAELARDVAAALARKRPSPLLRGHLDTWACGIVYALGYVNFLFDSTQEPYLSAEQLCDAFGVSKSTGYGKSRDVRSALGMYQFDPRWCLPSLVDRNPYVWMIEMDGLIMDVRSLPRAIQEIAYRKGLIPYVPEPVEKAPRGQPRKSTAEGTGEPKEPQHDTSKARKGKEEPEDPSQLTLDF